MCTLYSNAVKQPGTQVTVAMQMACKVVVVHVCVGGGGGGYHVLHKTCHACLSVIECVQVYTSPGSWCSGNIPAQLDLALF